MSIIRSHLLFTPGSYLRVVTHMHATLSFFGGVPQLPQMLWPAATVVVETYHEDVVFAHSVHIVPCSLAQIFHAKDVPRVCALVLRSFNTGSSC